MSDLAIQVRGLGKEYRIGHQARRKTFREAITDAALAPLRRLRQPLNPQGQDSFWALKDINFDINRGEVVGIIGRNGAGKSTLLKILSRITDPTTGEIEINGRVGSLLEVGTGFHSELTGRENIYLNGAILGMRRDEVTKKFDEIIAFSEVEKFLDTPVKHYSSGMYMRLAFAVASHLEPEILVVDEVLAVGDAKFQKKCLGRMSEVAEHGRTVLFVSHNMTAVKGLCKRAIWLDSGRVKMSGPCDEVVSKYVQMDEHIQNVQRWDDPATAPGNDQVRLHSIRITAATDATNEPITMQTPIRLIFEYWNHREGAHLNLSVVLSTVEGLPVFNTVSRPQPCAGGLIRSSFEIPGSFLNDGIHTVRLLIVRDEGTVLADLDDIAQFEVSETERDVAWHGKWLGATRPRLPWTTEMVAPG